MQHQLGSKQDKFLGQVEVGQRVYNTWHWGGFGIVFRITGEQAIPVRTALGWQMTGQGARYSIVFENGLIHQSDEFAVRECILSEKPLASAEDIARALSNAEQVEAREATEKQATDDRRANERKQHLQDNPHLLTPSGKPDWRVSRVAAENIRRELKRVFPTVKFSVRGDHNSIDINWTDGPTTDDVAAITQRHRHGNFDGMTDCYERNHDATFADVFGGVSYVFDKRDSTLFGERLAYALAGRDPKIIGDDWHNVCYLHAECRSVREAWSKRDLRPEVVLAWLADPVQQFADYVSNNWSNVIQRDGKWWIVRDMDWTLEFLAKDGWQVRKTDETSVNPDDTIWRGLQVIGRK